MEETNLILNKLEALHAQIDRLEHKLRLHDVRKAAYTQKEIVAALGLKGEQRELLDYMKKTGLLNSPITKKPLTYPGDVVRKAIKVVSAGKVHG